MRLYSFRVMKVLRETFPYLDDVNKCLFVDLYDPIMHALGV